MWWFGVFPRNVFLGDSRAGIKYVALYRKGSYLIAARGFSEVVLKKSLERCFVIDLKEFK